MISAYLSIDPAEVQAAVAHPRVWPNLQTQAPDAQTAVREYLTEPGCTFCIVRSEGELVGGLAIDRISETTGMAHNLLVPEVLSGADAVRAVNHALAFAFGPLGYLRVQGRTASGNRRALRFATAMLGMERMFATDTGVVTGVSLADWPWRQPGFFAVPQPDGTYAPDDVMVGLVARMAEVGAAARGVWLGNEYLAALEQAPMELVAADQTSALVAFGGRLWRLGSNGVEELQ